MANNENLKRRRNSVEPEKDRLRLFVEWMNKLAAAYRQEISEATQAMYFQELSDLAVDRLDQAFRHAMRQCRFFPTIAEIRHFEANVETPRERMGASYQRLRERIEAQPAVKMLSTTYEPPKPRMRPQRKPELTEAELEAKLQELRSKAEKEQ